MITLGIDPGINGAVAVFDNLTVINILDIPKVKWGSKQLLPNTKELIKIFKEYDPGLIVLERITTAPTDGVVSAGNFLQGVGRVEGCCSDYRLEYVIPRVWKTASGLVHKVKKASVGKATIWHPEAAKFIDGQKNAVDRADAVLITRFFLKFKERLK